MLTATEIETIKQGLGQFYGTENYYRYLAGLKLTDGVKYLADEAGAYWLLDIIASYQTKANIRIEHFQVWKLKLLPKDEIKFNQAMAVVTMQTDSDQPNMVKQEICYTDFPLESIEVWLIDGVMLLPSEY